MGISQRIRTIVLALREHGLELAGLEQGRHLKFRLRSGQVLVASKTPSDHHADANTLARIKRLADRPEDQKPKPPPKPRPPRVVKSRPAPVVVRWSPGPQSVQDGVRRARLRLDGGLTPKARSFDWGDRPTLSLKR